MASTLEFDPVLCVLIILACPSPPRCGPLTDDFSCLFKDISSVLQDYIGGGGGGIKSESDPVLCVLAILAGPPPLGLVW